MHREYLRYDARTLFSRLQPVVEDSDQVESMTSFVARLAMAHSIRPLSFITQFLDPGKKSSFLWSEVATAFNSITPKTEAIVKKMKELTGIHEFELKEMTFLGYAKVLDNTGHGLIAKSRKWCPLCYNEDRLNGSSVYDRRKWSLDLYNLCSLHRCKLQDRCSKCLELQPYISNVVEFGFCHFCRHFLGTEFVIIAEEEEVNAHSLIEEVGRLVNLRSDFALSVGLDSLAHHYRELSVEKLGDMCAVSPETIRKWIRMKEKPTLEALLLLCRTLRLGFHELMDYQRLSSESYRSLYDSYGQNESLNFSQRPSMVDKDQQKEEELLKEIVEGKKEPCSRKELAHLCGCSIGRLESRYPVLVREVARLYKSKRAEHKRQRIELLEEAIRRAATKAKRRGMNLSWRNLFSLIPEDMHYKYTVQEISRARDKILRSTM